MTMMSTTAVLCLSWSRSGQVTRLSSPRTSLANFLVPASTPLLCGCFCCAFLLDPFVVADPRFLPIMSFTSVSRAGGTRTHDLRFWRPLLFQLSYCPLPCRTTWSPGAPYDGGTTGNTFVAGCGPGCSAGSSCCGSSGACTRRKPALPIVAQLTSESQGRHSAAPSNAALLYYLRDDPGSHRAPTLPDGEVQTLVHRDRRDQLHVHHRVVSRHHHLHALFQPYLPRHISSAEVELRPVVREERRVPTALLLGKHVHLRLELRVRRDRARLGQDLPPLY